MIFKTYFFQEEQYFADSKLLIRLILFIELEASSFSSIMLALLSYYFQKASKLPQNIIFLLFLSIIHLWKIPQPEYRSYLPTFFSMYLFHFIGALIFVFLIYTDSLKPRFGFHKFAVELIYGWDCETTCPFQAVNSISVHRLLSRFRFYYWEIY